MKIGYKITFACLLACVYSSCLFAIPQIVDPVSTNVSDNSEPTIAPKLEPTAAPKLEPTVITPDDGYGESGIKPPVNTPAPDNTPVIGNKVEVTPIPKSDPKQDDPKDPCEGKTGVDFIKCDCGNNPWPGSGGVNACICNELHGGSPVQINECLCHLNAQSGDLPGTIGQCIAQDVCPIIPKANCGTGSLCCLGVVCEDKCEGLPKKQKKACYDKCMKQNSKGANTSSKNSSSKKPKTKKPLSY